MVFRPSPARERRAADGYQKAPAQAPGGALRANRAAPGRGHRLRAAQRQARERRARVRDRRAVRTQGRVTIATNMAGRGTDILPGATPSSWRVCACASGQPCVVMPRRATSRSRRNVSAAATPTSGAKDGPYLCALRGDGEAARRRGGRRARTWGERSAGRGGGASVARGE